MTDIPKHLIEAYESSDDYSDEHPVERILAALRPEDARYVLAWKAERAQSLADAEECERHLAECLAAHEQLTNELRAEVEHLKAEHTGCVSGERYDALVARYEKMIEERNEARQLSARLRAEMHEIDLDIFTAEHSMETDYRVDLERKVQELTEENARLKAERDELYASHVQTKLFGHD